MHASHPAIRTSSTLAVSPATAKIAPTCSRATCASDEVSRVVVNIADEAIGVVHDRVIINPQK